MSVVLEPVSDSAREEVEQPSVVEPDTAEEQPTEPPAQAADIQPKNEVAPAKWWTRQRLQRNQNGVVRGKLLLLKSHQIHRCPTLISHSFC